MKSKPGDISTVIIVNKDNGPKTLQVKTKHISRLKHYVLGVLALIFTLTGVIFYLRSENTRQDEEKKQLVAQINRLKKNQPATPAEVKAQANKAQNYVESIETKLQKINNYLKKRGLRGFSTKAIGGNSDTDGNGLSANEVYSLYDEYLGRLVHAIAFTPMGYPHISSLTSYFGYRSDPFNSSKAEFHPGIDFKGRKGQPARCTANGRVIFAGWDGGYGNCVKIAHANHYETLYGHLSRIKVKAGQEVTAGQEIGEIGSTGRSTGAHLHYEIRKDGKAINPIHFLSLNN